MAIEIALIVLVFVVSAIPLHLAVRMLHGNTTFLKTVFVSLLVGVAAVGVRQFFQIWAGFIAFVLMLWIYHALFDLSWPRAFFAWILQAVIVVALVFAIVALFGITLFTIAVL